MTTEGRSGRTWIDGVIRFVRHPATNLVVGIALVVSGMADALDDLRAGEGFDLAVHHGVIVYGLFKMLAALADVFEGIEKSLKRYEARD